VLRPDKDQAFVIHFDFEVELLEDLTNSREEARKGFEPVWTHPNCSASKAEVIPAGGAGAAAATTLYDAVFLAGDELMKKQRGRKALVLLSDGVDTGSKETLSSAVESAQRADTLVYSILFEDPNGYGKQHGRFRRACMGRRGGMGGGRGGGRYPTMNRPDGKKILEQISKRNRRPVLRGLPQVAHRQGLRGHRRGPAQPVQPRLHIRPAGQRTADIGESISPPDKKGCSCRPAKGTTRGKKIKWGHG